ncbi:MAG: ribonuclease HII [Candidatus Altiarchaeota archaeon]
MDILVCGVDEAGRGPVVGPLVLGCVLVDGNGAKKLRELKVRDSKKLTPSRREHLEPLIKSIAVEWRVLPISPADIDRLRKSRSLNVIEAQKTAQMIISLENRPSKIIIDAADAVEANYDRKIRESLEAACPGYHIDELVCEHKADDNYVEVSAASVLAKVARDRAIEDLKGEYGEFGSGYPSDPRTQEFVRKIIASGESPDCIRRSWNTMNRHRQTSLGDW